MPRTLRSRAQAALSEAGGRVEEVQPPVVDRELHLGAARHRAPSVENGGEDRAVACEELALVLVACSVAARTASAVTRGASMVKITWLSEPRSSTTSAFTRTRGSSASAVAPCSKSVGRTPSTTRPSHPGGR